MKPRKPVRGVFVMRNGKCVPIEEAHAAKPEADAPFVINDDIPPTESLATGEGKIFTSKRRLRQHYRDNGMIETGTAKMPKKGPPTTAEKEARIKDLRDDATRALNDLKYGNTPLSEKEKERCRQEERSFRAFLKRNQ